MPANLRITDLSNYVSVLPYDSELFGVYQPLLGWRSKRMEERFRQGFEEDRRAALDRLANEVAGIAQVNYKENNQVEIAIKPGVLKGERIRNFGSLVLDGIASKLPAIERVPTPDVWKQVINRDTVDTVLNAAATNYSSYFPGVYTSELTGGTTAILRRELVNGQETKVKRGVFEQQLHYESSLASVLLLLVEKEQFGALNDIFFSTQNKQQKVAQLLSVASATDPVEAFININNINPRDREHLQSVLLSPISVVHLFRQYFFELDSFLGSPVNHVWLSPGSSVELVEIHTRKTVVEKSVETALDLFTRTESSFTQKDELSEAVKESNQQDIKHGAMVKGSIGTGEATTSLDFSTSQQFARETVHKKMREQTEKLSSEIRKNFKTTFKTTSELTDVSNVRHVLSNNTSDLVNYELRRKMRQVGVQVQDVGTYLCWQTYVDDPGRELGVSKLIHIARSPELDAIPQPEQIPTLQPFKEERMVTIPFISAEGSGADKEDEVYIDGVEQDNTEWFGSLEKIQADFPQEFVCPLSSYVLQNIEFDPQGQPVQVSRKGSIENSNDKARFTLHLDMIDFKGKDSIDIRLILHWGPTDEANEAIRQQNEQNIKNYSEKERAEYEKTYIENVRDRVNKAGSVTARKSEELREEERIVVYRQLIQDMLMKGLPIPDDRTRHAIAELINSIFDVDKMLYFVAPEWWRPRLHRGRQQVTERPMRTLDTNFNGNLADGNRFVKARLLDHFMSAGAKLRANPLASATVGWGGINDAARDNYWITEESEPAKLGSSLGWLLQLDGDNLRNAFLNAPWVKAVIPIRPGKEEAAINWLKGVEGMNGITDDVIYHASNPNERDMDGNLLEGQRMIDVLHDLAKKIKKKYEEGIQTDKFPKQQEISDPQLVDEDSMVTATPIDRVYEHGFYPLNGSFRVNMGKNYEIFDQWIEVLPTDQIVPVPVQYDPKTGRQI